MFVWFPKWTNLFQFSFYCLKKGLFYYNYYLKELTIKKTRLTLMNPSLDKHMHIRLAVKPEQIQRLTLKTFL